MKQKIYIHLVTRIAIYAAIFCYASTSLAETSPVEMAVLEQWSGVFAGEKANFTVSIESHSDISGRLSWSVVSLGRIIFKNEQNIYVRSGQVQELTIDILPPGVKPGLSFPAKLMIEYVDYNTEIINTTLQKDIRLFSRTTFYNQESYLRSLNITLYDPIGTTEKLFQSINIPFKKITSLSFMHESTATLLVIGEEVKVDAKSDIGKQLLKMSALGMRVLCLAKAISGIAIDGTSMGIHQPDKVMFARKSILSDLSEIVDKNFWNIPELNASSAAVGANNPFWPWIEISYRKSGGKFVYNGFSIIKRWNESPTPRFFLRDLFEYMRKSAFQNSVEFTLETNTHA